MYRDADQARRRGELQSSLQYAEEGLRVCRDMRDSAWPLKFHLLKAELLLAQDRTTEARNLLENLPAGEARSDELQARLLMDLGQLQVDSGHPAEALALLGQASDLATKSGAASVQAWIELKRGLLLGNFNEADAAFHKALDIAARQHDDYFWAMALNNLGYLRMTNFRYDEAIPWFESAARTAQRIPSKRTHEQALGNLGVCYFRLGGWEHALDLLTSAERIAAEGHLAGDQQLWRGGIGVVYYSRGNFDKAIANYSQARDIAQRLGNKSEGARWLSNITRAYIDQFKWEEAEKYNRMALAGMPSEEVAPYLQINAGFIATARGRAREAESAFDAAIQLAKKTHQPNVEWQAHSGLAELYQSHNGVAAQKAFVAAISVLDREWLALSRDDSKITFRNYQASFYQDYVGFLSEKRETEKALEAAESSRARLLMQKLDGRTTALPVYRVADSIEFARETNCVLLSYWLAPKRSYLWAVTAKGVFQFILPAEAEVNALLDRHRKSIENLEDPLTSGSVAARQLYRMLLGPVQPLLKQAARVIIVPDGKMHEVNLETLVAEEPAAHYWIDDATPALAPSLAALRSQTAQPVSKPRLLIIGDPLPADPEFPTLPYLKTEIREIAAGFAESDRAVYAGAEAYAERFREANPRAFTAIHFAAHATANEESPLNSAIILSAHNGKYKLYANEVTDLRLDPELVTVSACRSAGSKAYSGEGLIGFSWAFLDAGAHNVVAGIWNVDDAAAPVLMKAFYEDWRRSRDPAAALRSAKLQLMRMGGAYRKPYYWGPFEVFTRQATRSAIDLAWRNSSK